ncbi:MULTISPECIES: hypothetical protein [Thermoanaerobacterium]|uniref:Lipoprotein n=2 Tax=Thermoanaerobacterium TaxID=28895 RepID=W9ECL4_9THEO|nr:MULTISPECIES: hypothetical protein [Thermoanaerobacterium]AFK85910.1 hypothetical protein Tsac_0894 [Thermoanaerobacterium saccharolyticum JW/SL-YS485]ETO38750.1 hypothetical protein V518_1172 [Thermoanaerobacterium aotearoense SCUT27]
MKKLMLILLSLILVVSVTACGKIKNENKISRITNVSSNTVTIGNEKVNLQNIILVSGTPSELKKGEEAYIAKGKNNEYLVTYTKEMVNKLNNGGLDVYGKIKNINSKEIILEDGKSYKFASNVNEQTVYDDFKTVKKFNINDFSGGDIVRFYVDKNGEITSIVKY